jgi:hypothetical protein
MLLLMLLFQSTEFANKTTFPWFIYCDTYAFYHLHIPFFNPAQCLNVLHRPQLFVPIMGRLPNTLYLCCQWLCSTHTQETAPTGKVVSAPLHTLLKSFWTVPWLFKWWWCVTGWAVTNVMRIVLTKSLVSSSPRQLITMKMQALLYFKYRGILAQWHRVTSQRWDQ